jgi:crotonobetainyl-CoA:carnitine CoA-transferase CaiB-like acyl-CoA transferase
MPDGTVANAKLPLAGIRVLEMGRFVAAPLASQTMGDLGAEIIKIERKGEGDDFRRYGLVRLKDKDGKPMPDSAPYTSMNRNKRSVVVDLSGPGGAEVVRSLAQKCDIFVENFKVGSLAQYKLDYESLRAANPGVIYLSVTAFGQWGPYAARPGVDTVFQAMSGLMDISGEVKGEPTKVGTYACDYVGGLYGAVAILAALRHRDQTGEGQHIDLSLLETSMAFLAPRSAEYLIGNKPPRRLGNRTAGMAPAQLFYCSDGYLMVQAGLDAMYATLCKVLGRPELLTDPRFATLEARLTNIDALADTLQETFRTRTSKEWYDLLVMTNVLVAPIYDVAQSFADPHTVARGVRITVPHPNSQTGTIDLVANPMRFSATPITEYRAPPTMGEGTDDVLAGWLGYDTAKIADLRAAGTL